MADGDAAFFLDTSVHVSKEWEDDKVKYHLYSKLPPKSCHSSIYVKNEYKHRILSDAILVYNIIVDSVTLDEAKSRLDEIMKLKGRNENSLPYKVYRKLFKQYKTKKKRILQRLEILIESAWENYFKMNVQDTLLNLTECNSAQEDIQKRDDGHYLDVTSRCVSGCKINDFLGSQKSNLNILANIDDTKLIRTSDPKGTLQKVKSTSDAILKGEQPRGKHCKEMSDAVISMEAEACCPGITLHSMDSDFKLLGDVLNIKTCVHSKTEILKKG